MTTVNVRDFGAIGNGQIDDADAIQLAVDHGSTILLPDTSVFYRVTKPILIGGSDQSGGKRLVGQRNCRGGFGVPLVQGIGSFPIFSISGTASTQNRSIELVDLSAYQLGGPVLSANFAYNLSLNGVFFSSSSNKTETVGLLNSAYVSIRESTINCSGGGFALTAYSQCNKISIVNNRFTGGSIGGACHLEQIQSGEYRGNLTEIGIYGLVINSGVRLDNPSAGNVIGAGASHGITIVGNYFESVQNPIVIASAMNLPGAGQGQAVFGLTVQGNIIGTTFDAPLITYGRVDGGLMQANSLWRKLGAKSPHILSTFAPVPGFAAPTISQNHLTN